MHLPHFEVNIFLSRKFHNTSKCKITGAKHVALPQSSADLFKDCIPTYENWPLTAMLGLCQL